MKRIRFSVALAKDMLAPLQGYPWVVVAHHTDGKTHVYDWARTRAAARVMARSLTDERLVQQLRRNIRSVIEPNDDLPAIALGRLSGHDD